MCKYPGAERVHAYARAVVAGKIVAGYLVVAACQRHIDDLEQGHERGLVFKEARAESAIVFFEQVLFLKPDTPFKLEDYQAFIIGSMFGWYRNGGDRRRFRECYTEMGKGNGKTPLGAGAGLYGLMLDGEHAAEIYSAAAAKDQAMICFNDAAQMVQASPALKQIYRLTKSLTTADRKSVFRPLSSDDKVSHGLRVHMAILDEIHAHASGAMVKIVTAGTKNCRNAIIWLLTNSGAMRRSICWDYHQRATQMLVGKKMDDALFAYVCTLNPCPKCKATGYKQPNLKCEKCDDWRDKKNWKKANPGLGTVLDEDYVAGRVAVGQRMPSELNIVLQLNCCMWTESAAGWADMSAWRSVCLDLSLKIEDFAGQPCWLGMDAANRVDCTCLAVIFERKPGEGAVDFESLPDAAKEALAQAIPAPPPVEDHWAEDMEKVRAEAIGKLAAMGYAVFLRTYVPEDMVNNSSQANHESYRAWQQEGWLTVTPGAITDFARIEDDIRELDGKFMIRRLQADPRELGYLLQRIAGWAGFEVVQVSQGATMISQPMKFFEGLIAAGLMKHDGNPVLDWMLGNVEQKTTRTGGPVKYYYPTRPSESQKIDGVPASLMALDAALRGGEQVSDPGMVMLG